MKFIEQIYRLEQTDQLIRMEVTGCSENFARKLNVSRSTLFELLKCLKQLGADIYYNHDKLSYVYKVPIKLVFKLEKQELNKISGGKITQSEKIGLSFFNIVLN